MWVNLARSYGGTVFGPLWLAMLLSLIVLIIRLGVPSRRTEGSTKFGTGLIVLLWFVSVTVVCYTTTEVNEVFFSGNLHLPQHKLMYEQRSAVSGAIQMASVLFGSNALISYLCARANLNLTRQP